MSNESEGPIRGWTVLGLVSPTVSSSTVNSSLGGW